MNQLQSYFKQFTRRKQPTAQSVNLQPILSFFSLTFLGIGQCLATGVFIIVGLVARQYAGPSAILSFLFASMVIFPTTMCYAEFGCRFRQTGSSYIYTYSSLGEIYAFISGWSMYLEFVLTGAAQGRAIVEYIDVLLNGKLEQFNEGIFGKIDAFGSRHSLNIIGVVITVLVILISLTGTRGTSRSNEILSSIKILAVVFIIVSGCFFIDTDNWSDFMPFGIQGVIKGTVSSFFTLIGFEVITTASEEAKDPKYSIPRAVLMFVFILCTAYIGVAAVLTLMVPYYKLSSQAPLVSAFELVGLHWAKYIILFSGVAAMFAVLITSLFGASRIIYSMACDGLFFKYFSKIDKKRIIPVRAIVFTGLLIAAITFALELPEIVEGSSIGSLVSYLMVALALLFVRFIPEKPSDAQIFHSRSWFQCLFSSNEAAGYQKLQEIEENEKITLMQKNMKFVYLCITFMIIMLMIVLSILNFAFSALVSGSPLIVTALVLSSLALMGAIVPLFCLPRHQFKFDFTVPMVPLTPIICIILDLFLVLNVNWSTLIRFLIWSFIGFMIYVFYGVHNSVLRKMDVDVDFIEKFPASESQNELTDNIVVDSS